MIVKSLVLCASTSLGGLLATIVQCTDGCAATASVTAIPAGGCGGSMPTYEVDWVASTSGHCDGCQVVSHCDNHAIITIKAAAGTFLNGGGFSCSGGGEATAEVVTCGQASVSQVHVHGGNPCTAGNQRCTVYITIGCKNC